jgi:PACS-1 cytosolic sorting protein
MFALLFSLSFFKGESALAKYIIHVDSFAGEMFDNAAWHCTLDQQNPDNVDWEVIVDKIRLYCQEASFLLNLPVAQALINFKSHG